MLRKVYTYLREQSSSILSATGKNIRARIRTKLGHDDDVRDAVGREIEDLLDQWAKGTIPKDEAFQRIRKLRNSISEKP